MSQEKLQTMIMQNLGGVKEVYYGFVQVENEELTAPTDPSQGRIQDFS